MQKWQLNIMLVRRFTVLKLIHIYSNENEYAIEDFNSKNISIKEAYKKAENSPDNTWEFVIGSYCKAVSFAYVHVTPDFIDFVKSVIGDKDMMKHEDFYVVEE